MKNIEIHTLQDTNDLATKIASLLNGKGCICLAGDLGAGKTTFTKALGKAIGIEDVITSPTFTILKIYEGEPTLYHIDAYRLEGITHDLGFEEVFEDDGIVVVEWYAYIQDILPKEYLQIHIELDKDKRIFEIEGIGEKYQQLEGEL